MKVLIHTLNRVYINGMQVASIYSKIVWIWIQMQILTCLIRVLLHWIPLTFNAKFIPACINSIPILCYWKNRLRLMTISMGTPIFLEWIRHSICLIIIGVWCASSKLGSMDLLFRIFSVSFKFRVEESGTPFSFLIFYWINLGNLRYHILLTQVSKRYFLANILNS